MIVEVSMTVELFMIMTKKILMSEKIIGAIILKQGRHIVFDSVIIKLPLLIS